MAGIDKTYFNTWEQYTDVIDWASHIGCVTDEYGNRFNPLEFAVKWTKDKFDEAYANRLAEGKKHCSDQEYIKNYKERYGDDATPYPYAWCEFILWNTPTYFDVWLIRNCPIDFVQKRLKEQYASYYEDIKNHTSEYDKPRYEGSHKFIVIKKYDEHFKDDGLFWWVQIYDEPNGMMYLYNDTDKMWYDFHECRSTNSNTAHFRGNISKRKLDRIIKRWDLPKGITLRFKALYNRYAIKEFLVKIL